MLTAITYLLGRDCEDTIVHSSRLGGDYVRRRIRDVGGAVACHEAVVVLDVGKAEYVTDLVGQRPSGRTSSDDGAGSTVGMRGATVRRRVGGQHEVHGHVVRADVVAVREQLSLLLRGLSPHAPRRVVAALAPALMLPTEIPFP